MSSVAPDGDPHSTVRRGDHCAQRERRSPDLPQQRRRRDDGRRLALAKHRREALLQKTVYFDAKRVGIDDLPRGALILINRDDTALAPLLASGQLRQLAAIPEPGDPPHYFVVER
jgi:hypothetical protein